MPSITTAIIEYTRVCSPLISRLRTFAPAARGRIIVATPAAKMKVIAMSPRRRCTPVARYAGSMTDTQHGAKSATMPPRKAATTEVLNKSDDKWTLPYYYLSCY
jgi:hypothetical protein